PAGNVLSSLAVYAEDSEPESDSEAGGVGKEKGGLVSESYGEDDFSKMEGEEDGYDEDDDENSRQSVGILLYRNHNLDSWVKFPCNFSIPICVSIQFCIISKYLLFRYIILINEWHENTSDSCLK
uniref:Uncharacterized protein n=1 Tax=Laticauda laticaudata TaxID=8630 RepID=A0A8C5SCU6_LATLA